MRLGTRGSSAAEKAARWRFLEAKEIHGSVVINSLLIDCRLARVVSLHQLCESTVVGSNSKVGARGALRCAYLGGRQVARMLSPSVVRPCLPVRSLQESTSSSAGRPREWKSGAGCGLLPALRHSMRRSSSWLTRSCTRYGMPSPTVKRRRKTIGCRGFISLSGKMASDRAFARQLQRKKWL